MFANFGSKVTILEAASLFLPREDRDIADNIATILRDQGVDIILNAHVERISHHENQVQVHSEHAQLAVDALLIASGRQTSAGQLSLTSNYIPPQTIFGRWEMLPAGCNLLIFHWMITALCVMSCWEKADVVLMIGKMCLIPYS
ncbi:pyridine nucleotide-disulfide oxidoreductase [Shigella sonnei]|nr:pyridine nucleotide-disulfide oxidoreductase [Shigella sonnei]